MNELDLAAQRIREADAVLAGACNGFSISEGIRLFAADQAFEELFGDMRMRCGISCLLHGMAARWPSETEKWTFWSRLVRRHCLGYRPGPMMKDLVALLKDREHFLLTTNGECHFELAGFDPARIWEIEGTWTSMQCARPCHGTVYPCQDLLGRMAREGVSPELVPVCPRCGGPMQVHMQTDGRFLPNLDQERRFLDFLARFRGRRIVILELGVGPRNRLVKAPLMRLAAREPQAFYAAANIGEIFLPDELSGRSVGLMGSLEDTLSQLRRRLAP